ncbi:Armadillo repeat-containing protein 5 [Homalodisca vitripennis]|nr:Armadillo repeat-containing protein 5 [Homalodisca vitripennis]
MSKTGHSVGIIKLINQLEKCSSSQSIYKLLVQIRTDVIKEDEGIKLLRDKGGLKRIVKILTKPNEKILNVSLSILANCCLQEECREQVVAYGGIPIIIGILKNLNQESIQSRACRLIGNLTQNYKIAEKFHEHHIVPVLVSVLNSSSTPSTQQMAIRTLRLLWEVPKYRLDMLKAEVVKAVAVHLSTNDCDVKSAVIKALATFTKSLKSSGIAVQAQGGRADLSLLVQEVGDPTANLCLYNLSCLEISRLQLVKDGLVELVVAKLNNGVDHWLAMIFFLLCQDSIGRAHIRNCERGLELLVQLLQITKSKVIRSKAFQALTYFLYDKSSLETISDPADYEIHSVTIFLNARNVKQAEIYRQLGDVYREDVMSEGMVRVRMFNGGRTNVHDENRPSLVTDDLVREVDKKIQENRRFTMTTLSDNSNQFHILFCTKLLRTA